MKFVLPYTYLWIVSKHLQGCETVLDVGSGDGEFMRAVNEDHIFEVEGVELYPLYIKKSRRTGVYKKVTKLDVLKMDYKKKSFDGVLCSQVIEHVTKKDANKLFNDMEKYAKKVVIIGTPNGHYDQDEYDGNKLQKHLSHWQTEDFEKRGYKVYGQALKFIYGEKGLLSIKLFNLPLVKHLLFALSYILSPFVYNKPQYAAHLIAVKSYEK